MIASNRLWRCDPMRLAISFWMLACLLVAACQPAAPSPTKPAGATAGSTVPAAKPAESPAAKPSGSPDAKPVASPAAAAASKPEASVAPPVNVDVEDAARYFNGKTITVTVGF